MKKLLTLLFILISIQSYAQLWIVNADSVRLGNPTGAGSLSVYGKTFLKNITEGTSMDSVLVRGANGEIKFVKRSSIVGSTSSNLNFTGGLVKNGNNVFLGGAIDDIGLGGNSNRPMLIMGSPNDLGTATLSYGAINSSTNIPIYAEVGISHPNFDNSWIVTRNGVWKGAAQVTLMMDSQNGAELIDGILNKGITEAADYSANKTQYSYVTKKMLTDGLANVSGGGGNFIQASPATPQLADIVLKNSAGDVVGLSNGQVIFGGPTGGGTIASSGIGMGGPAGSITITPSQMVVADSGGTVLLNSDQIINSNSKGLIDISKTGVFIANDSLGTSTLLNPNILRFKESTLKIANLKTNPAASGENDYFLPLNSGTLATLADISSNSGGSSSWGGITGTLSSQTDLQTALNAKANLASPALTGTPTAPTPIIGDNSTQIATTKFVFDNAPLIATTNESLIDKSTTNVNVTRAIILGVNAGNGSIGSSNSNFIGYGAGIGTSGSTGSNFIGTNSGLNSTNVPNSNYIGIDAGNNSSGAVYSNFMGANSGQNATNAYDSNFIGASSGLNASGASGSNFIGRTAGRDAVDASKSNFIGISAGKGAANSSNSNFIGISAGQNASIVFDSNFIGSGAGLNSPYASNSNFIGSYAGNGSLNSSYSNFIGFESGNDAKNIYFSNFMGYRAGKAFSLNNVGNNNIIIGTNISLPNATANAINIGGVLFGSGTNPYINGVSPSIVPANGKIGINKVSPTAVLDVVGILEYADNAAALSAGLTAGAFYRTGDLLKVVH